MASLTADRRQPKSRSEDHRGHGLRRLVVAAGRSLVALLFVVGLGLTPVTCARVHHPHSIFEMPPMPMAAHPAGQPGLSGPLPGISAVVTASPGLAELVDRAQRWARDNGSRVGAAGAVGTGSGTVLSLAVAPELARLADLPTISPASMTMSADGSSLLLLVTTIGLLVALIAVRPLARLLPPGGPARAVPNPPPRPTTAGRGLGPTS